MPKTILGLDMGSNSVGSAWIDMKKGEIHFGISHFPAGVEKSESRRGAPKGQKRRQTRLQRRTIERRAERKCHLRQVLADAGLLPSSVDDIRKFLKDRSEYRPSDPASDEDWWQAFFNINPWHLRRRGLADELSCYEFGRLLVHLNQRRGALGIEHLPDEKENKDDDEKMRDDKKAKRALNHTTREMKKSGSKTFGEFMANLMDERQYANDNKKKTFHHGAIRNRRDGLVDKADEAFFADRPLIRHEFRELWNKQRSFGGDLAAVLTNDLMCLLDDPHRELYETNVKRIWRDGGAIFGQRDTYWKVETLGRCDLEPTDRCCPHADMYAQEFRLLDFVNNLRFREGGRLSKNVRPLNAEQRDKTLANLTIPQMTVRKGQETVKKSFSVNDVKKTLGIDNQSLKRNNLAAGYYDLTLSQDGGDDGGIKAVSDWFQRDIVHRAFGQDAWTEMTQTQHDAVNAAILKFDPEKKQHVQKLRAGAQEWWHLSAEGADAMVEAWKSRPKLEVRLSISRKAAENLLSVMRQPDPDRPDEYPNQMRARQLIAYDPQSGLTPEQRVRYAPELTEDFVNFLMELVGEEKATKALRLRGMNKASRHYLKKHPGTLLPPAPFLANPVVRKAIHEARRHVLAHLEAHRKPNGEVVIPDRVVIELAREGRQSAKVRDAIYTKNKAKEKIRKQIIADYGLDSETRSQQKKAIERVLLCRQQNFVCPYTTLSRNDRKEKGLSEDGQCVYTGKVITERQAVIGEAVEVDHIIPYSRCGDNSLNNKVLCCTEANRSKGNDTPKEWLGEDSEEFLAMQQRMRHLNVSHGKTGPSKQDYFTTSNYRRKWKNLHRDPSPDEFRNSQLSDTAYAAKEIGDFLRAALYGGETQGKQRVFFTNGKLTARLRNDWQLYREIREPILKNDPDKMRKDERNWQQSLKDRGDHRHHAIDAAVIALTPAYFGAIAEDEHYCEEYYQATGRRARRKRMDQPAPWVSVEEFRRDVLSKLYDTFDRLDDDRSDANDCESGKAMIISHRAVNRRIMGALHKATAYGIAAEYPGLYTERKSAKKLEPAELRVRPKRDSETGIFTIPGKGQGRVIRDAPLRREIIACLKRHGIDPDSFSKKDIKKLTDGKSWDLCMKSGVPIRSVTMLLAMSDPVCVKGSDGVERYYVGGNNHHMEILEDEITGAWSGECWKMIDVAQRVRPRKGEPRLPMVIGRELDRLRRDGAMPDDLASRYEGKRFVMSLAIGETFEMKREEDLAPDYFVVVKTSKKGVFFVHHWDNRPEKKKDGMPRRDSFERSASQLQKLGPVPGKPPLKVRVGPLGDITPMPND